MKLNLGCGRDIKEGWVNVDKEKLFGVNVLLNLELPNLDDPQAWNGKFPFDVNSVDEILMSHILEHISNTLPLMQELHRIAKPNCLLTVKCPYGSSDNADEDPQHVRRYFLKSFHYFAQPSYWQADYGYRGDWKPEKIVLEVPGHKFQDSPTHYVMQEVMQKRNTVSQMIVTMRAVKPIREPEKDLMDKPAVLWRLV